MLISTFYLEGRHMIVRKDLVHDASLAVTVGVLLGVELVHKTRLLVCGGSGVVVT
jgi:hypothetical protein